MITGLVNRIKNKILYNSLKTELELYKDYNQYSSLPLLIQENKVKFEKTFHQYVSEVSIDTMAISLELATTLYSLCLLKKPKVVLDLGSGYSSYVFRYYQKNDNPDCLVYSVDDNVDWLVKTKEYLLSQGVSTNLVLNIDEIQALENTKFDIILHDMNFVEVRKDYLDFVFSILNKDGIVLLDDIHKPEYLRECITKLKNKSWDFYGLHRSTTDKFKRFSVIGINNRV